MVQLILSFFIFFAPDARPQFLGFGESGSELKSRVPDLVEQLKSQEMKTGPLYEELFNKGVVSIENAMEEEKLYCSGEAVDSTGKVLPADKKQLCMRELKKHYLEAMTSVYELKKKYLEMIHANQIEKMDEQHSALKVNIEKRF